MVDKYEAKEYVASIIGEQYIIPTLGVWDRIEDIDFDSLPRQFVLKCTHDSGGVVICRDKSAFDKEQVVKKLSKALRRDFIAVTREYPYKDVQRRIIAEQLLESGSEHDLHDYKFFCFNGHCECFKIDYGRFTEHHANYYSPNGKMLPFGEKAYMPEPNPNVELPSNLNEMIAIAERLAKDMTFVRVDLYNVNRQIFFGELTFFPASGFGQFIPDEWDYKLGGMIHL